MINRFYLRCPTLVLAFLAVWPSASRAPAMGAAAHRLEPPPHGFFTALPKEYGHLLRIDAHSVEVALDRGGERLVRKLVPGADLFHHGGPATPADFSPGDRVWVVMEGNAKKGERGDVRFFADEISVQDIHTEWYTLKEVDTTARTLTFEVPALAGGKPAPAVRLPVLPAAQVRLGSRLAKVTDLTPGTALRFQSRSDGDAYVASVIADAGGFEALRKEQQRALERQLARLGLPGSAAADPASGDWEVVVDRPGALWARTLSPGDNVRLRGEDTPEAPPVPVTVSALHPWGERTRVVLRPSVAALPAELPARVHLLMPSPRMGGLPPGLGRATSAEERIEWILASIYCTCGNSNDVCTGQLYTLSLCSPKGCPMPNLMRGRLAGWIAEGKTDAEILKRIETEQGPQCHRMHLVK